MCWVFIFQLFRRRRSCRAYWIDSKQSYGFSVLNICLYWWRETSCSILHWFEKMKELTKTAEVAVLAIISWCILLGSTSFFCLSKSKKIKILLPAYFDPSLLLATASKVSVCIISRTACAQNSLFFKPTQFLFFIR